MTTLGLQYTLFHFKSKIRESNESMESFRKVLGFDVRTDYKGSKQGLNVAAGFCSNTGCSGCPQVVNLSQRAQLSGWLFYPEQLLGQRIDATLSCSDYPFV